MKSCDTCSTRRQFLEQLAILPGALGLGRSKGGWAVSEGTPTRTRGEELTYPLPAADGVTIDRKAQVIIARVSGVVVAFNLACPHENTALRWRQNDNRFQCPRHESKYRPTGDFYEGRATRNMDRFAIRRDGASIVVDLARLFHSDTNRAEWDAAVIRL